MIRVELSKIIIDEKRDDQIIVLKEKDGERQFPIVIGFLEATSIKMILAGVKTPRPLTHDLLATVISIFNAKMESLAIDKMIKNTFHAKLTLLAPDGSRKVLDVRPSDGIALAVRSTAPIYVHEKVLEQATIFNIDTD